MSDQAILRATPNATSLLAWEVGPTHYDLLASRIRREYGPQAAHANLSARQAKALGLMTSGTSGRTSTGSLRSANLTRSLGNKVQARARYLGSTLYKLTYKDRITPSGWLIPAVRATAPRTSASARTGWVTPTTRDWKDSAGMSLERTRDDRQTSARLDQLPRQALVVGWPTPTACDSNRHPAQDFQPTPNMTLNHAATVAGWPTPAAADSRRGATDARPETKDTGRPLNEIAHLAGWPTPTAQSPQSLRGKGQDPMVRQAQGHAVNLTDAVNFIDLNSPARLTASGEMLTGSSAAMPSGGQLDPAHSLWLMGYPIEFLYCGLQAMLSMPNRRKASSKPSSKPSLKATK